MRTAIEFIKNKFSKELVGVEVGVKEGVNAEDILKNLNMGKLYLVDIWGFFITEGVCINYENEYEKVLKKFENDKNVIIKKQTSLDAVKEFKDNSLDFVYIDACHQYLSVKADIKAWLPKIKKGGVLSGHDYEKDVWHGTIKAVDEFIKETNYKLNTKETDWWITK